jgi:hypothetical protein
MDERLLLLSHDELLILWDALMRHRLAVDVGDPDFDDIVRMTERVEELLDKADFHP